MKEHWGIKLNKAYMYVLKVIFVVCVLASGFYFIKAALA